MAGESPGEDDSLAAACRGHVTAAGECEPLKQQELADGIPPGQLRRSDGPEEKDPSADTGHAAVEGAEVAEGDGADGPSSCRDAAAAAPAKAAAKRGRSKPAAVREPTAPEAVTVVEEIDAEGELCTELCPCHLYSAPQALTARVY